MNQRQSFSSHFLFQSFFTLVDQQNRITQLLHRHHLRQTVISRWEETLRNPEVNTEGKYNNALRTFQWVRNYDDRWQPSIPRNFLDPYSNVLSSVAVGRFQEWGRCSSCVSLKSPLAGLVTALVGGAAEVSPAPLIYLNLFFLVFVTHFTLKVSSKD